MSHVHIIEQSVTHYTDTAAAAIWLRHAKVGVLLDVKILVEEEKVGAAATRAISVGIQDHMPARAFLMLAGLAFREKGERLSQRALLELAAVALDQELGR